MQINIRMSVDEVMAIDKFIESGDFDNRVEFIRFAVRKTLQAYEPGARVGFKLE